jgi:leucyl-tRNA---protein transferase
MESLFRFTAPPTTCGYLPGQLWSLEYEYVGQLTPAEYRQRLEEGWRRFGHALFRPGCRACQACQSIRVIVDRFVPDRSQRRAQKANEGIVELRVGEPSTTRAKLALYDRFHAFQADAKGWPLQPAKDAEEYTNSFVANPFRTQEWCYHLKNKLIGVGYVDDLPGGLSAIYFFYDPAERGRSLGTWNVLNVIRAAEARGVPFVYLGYYVENCPSMMYKARFRPNQLLGADGQWHDFLRPKGCSGLTSLEFEP